MAEHGHQAHGQGADSAGMAEHLKSYNLFLTMTKWSLGGIILIMVILAIFRTHNGLP